MRDHRMPALRTIALVVIVVWGATAHAAGLGPIRVQSALGHSLRASVPVIGADAPELTASCLNVTLQHPDGAVMMAVLAAVARSGPATTIHLTTRQPVNEPAAILHLAVSCGTPVQRSYQLLLDPVLLLPQLAPAPQEQGSRPARGANGEQAMVAPAEGVARMPASTRGARKGTSSARQESRKPARSVLKLSSDDVAVDLGATFTPALKLSDTLSESRDTGDAQKAAELKSAYAQFALLMRDEDPVRNGEKQFRDMQAKLQELERQTVQLREQSAQQRKADQAALASLRRDTVSSGWVIAMGGLLLAVLAAIGWLYLRLKESGRGQESAFWQRAGLEQSTEAGDWDNSLGGSDNFVAATVKKAVPAESLAPAETAPSDWERGIPLDDTLAVDWASRQGTLQSPPPSAAPAAVPRQQPPVVAVRPVAASRHDGAPTMKVDAIAGLMQEAEFWMLLNDPERAIEILAPCASVDQPVSPVPWIYLLDLYRITCRRDGYLELAARIKTVFNTSAPDWSEAGTEASARSLRDYPHVVQAIEELWEGEDIVPYLENLLLDEREGARTGFDLAVYREIIHLLGVACDPDVPRRREQLSFDQPQARLISQTVSMPAATPARALAPIEDEDADGFDRATSRQAISRQGTLKTAAPKPPAAAPAMVPARALAEEPGELAVDLKTPEPANLAASGFSENLQADAKAAEDAERMADMARKLDLVMAYQEIGENVGARVLLEEVIQGGSPLQVEKAKAMLKRLLKEIDWQ